MSILLRGACVITMSTDRHDAELVDVFVEGLRRFVVRQVIGRRLRRVMRLSRSTDSKA